VTTVAFSVEPSSIATDTFVPSTVITNASPDGRPVSERDAGTRAGQFIA
jgi:hypothetical protein